MAVPKKKTSKARSGRRKAENTRKHAPTLAVCPKCKESALPHTICKNCGTYRGKQILENN